MRVAVVSEPGAVPVAGEFPDPEASAGIQIVDLVAAGIHPIVRSLAAGAHYGSGDGWPMVPGVDAVVRTADGRLAYAGFAPEPYGTLGEKIPVRMVMPLPEDADPVALAAAMNPGMSSWLPLTRYLEDPATASVLVLGATGSSGRLAIQNARALGVPTILAAARDISAVGALPDLGATATVSLEKDALGDAIAEHTPTLVLDYCWGPVAETALVALGSRGLATFEHPVTYVEIGSVAGQSASIPSAVLRSRAITLVGSGAGSVAPDLLRAGVVRYAELLASGEVRVDATAYPLDDIATAWADTSSAHRVVVTP